MVLPSLWRLPPPNFLHTQQRRAPALVGDCNRLTPARAGWVMSPSPGDALVCCVKRAVPR
ncbi:hypothetical protein CEP66_24625 [Citrobacter koseri]|nr:hypothetical protein AM351_17295 [Citrobacter koseri]AVK73988.1 hypothetical protein CEP66_24625 [Citrobacter koseri]PNN12184.1 hypothetical protein AL526_005375 [Citrobacter koseri]